MVMTSTNQRLYQVMTITNDDDEDGNDNNIDDNKRRAFLYNMRNDVSWLDAEATSDAGNEETLLNINTINSNQKPDCENNVKSIPSRDIFALESFCEELDRITKPLDDGIDLEELFQKARKQKSYIINSSLQYSDGVHTHDSPVDDVVNGKSVKGRNTTPMTYNYGSVEATRSVASSRKSEPPTPVKTPANDEYRIRGTRQTHRETFRRETEQQYSTPELFASHINRDQDDDIEHVNRRYNSVEPGNQRNYYVGRSVPMNHDKSATSVRPASVQEEGKMDVHTSTSKQPSLADEPKYKGIEWMSILDAMRDTLAQKDTHIRHLEQQNLLLRSELDEIRQIQGGNTFLRVGEEEEVEYTRTPTVRLQSPPPVAMSSKMYYRTPTSSDQFFLTRSNGRAAKAPVPSARKQQSDRMPPHGTNYDHQDSNAKDQMLYHERYFDTGIHPNSPIRQSPRLASNSRYRHNARHMSNRDVLEYYDDNQFNLDRQHVQDRTTFSPGTQFVEELSRVVEVKRGHYAPLSLIMDKHFDKTSQTYRYG